MKRPKRPWEQWLLRVSGALGGLLLLVLLLMSVSELPDFGAADSPANNEVLARYLEEGLAETGAVNLVTGLILDYRAFDTFGETLVLLAALVSVLILLRRDEADLRQKADLPAESMILRETCRVLLPMLLLFGIYVVLNGHISPGGGFSGGVLLGAAGILANVSFGRERVGQVLTYRRVLAASLIGSLTYCLCKFYVFFRGGNHLPTHIPLGEPGALFSGGLLPVLNLCVGLVVGCAIYGFYCLFFYDEI